MGGPTDFVEVDALREAIEWPPGSWFFTPILESGGYLPLVRDDSGSLIGMGLGAAFGTGGFIGNMVVQPERQRRGIGATVFEHLLRWFETKGVTNVQLEATPEGQPLYERYGFTPRWESVTGVCTALPDPGDSVVHAVTEADWVDVRKLAMRAYGHDREAFFRALAAYPETEEAAVLRDNGRVTAFAIRRPGRVGPLVADSETAAESLARALLNRAGEGVRVPIGNPRHNAFWERLGVEIEPNDVRMTFGAPPADEPALLFAMLNGGVG